MSEPVPPSVRAQLLGIEHGSLLAARGARWRVPAPRPRSRRGVLVTGSLTLLRVHYASHEDAQLVRGMNRMRRGYVDLDPGIEPYLMTGFADDGDGLRRSYGFGFPRSALNQVLASAVFFSCVVNALVAGGWVGILASPAGPSRQSCSGC